MDQVTCLLPNGWPTERGTGICDPHDLAHTWYGRTTAEGDGCRLHDRFARRVLGGEWFDFTDVADPVATIAEAARGLLKNARVVEPST